MNIINTFWIPDVILQPSGFIKSINYPNEYPNNYDARYAILGVNNSLIEIKMEDFFIEEGYDFLTVRL